MELTSVPIIVISCYLIGELYKILFRKKQELNKIIPILTTIMGGVLGVVIYLTNPEMIVNAQNVWVALEIGIVSGATSTTTNQIKKQLTKKEK